MTTALFLAASAEFETYAALDAPCLPNGELSALQVRLWRWQVEQFGVPDDRDLVLGIIEECGELEDSDGLEAQEDAIGDTLIYATQLCTSQRLCAATIMAEVQMKSRRRFTSIPIVCGRLAHTALKTQQKIRGYGDRDFSRGCFCELLAQLFSALLWQTPQSLRVRDIYVRVAEEVMLRNWKADPIKAGG